MELRLDEVVDHIQVRYKCVWPHDGYERGQDVPSDKVTEYDLQFNRVVPYHYSAPPPQQDKETPPPPAHAAGTKRRLTTEENK